MQFTAYLAAKGCTEDLLRELGEVSAVHDRLVLADGPPRPAYFAQNVWLDPRFIEFSSISQAASALRELQAGWALYDFTLHRRAKLIEEKLPRRAKKPHDFGNPAPAAPLGSWTLIDQNTILAAPTCTSPFANGEVEFVENKIDPPNRAYLKLWEYFTLSGKFPRPGDFCLDLGGSPGGWTWVLAGLGARVLCLDKAPLEPRISAMPGVEFRQASAFSLEPREFTRVDWLFSDVICYPERLFKFIERWRSAGVCRNFVCTLKLQGETDFESIRLFAALPGSEVRHLSCNKHELTWSLTD